MGVLHMTMPTAGYLPRPTRARERAAVSRITKPQARVAAPKSSTTPVMLQDSAPQTPVSGTLLPSVNITPQVAHGTTLRPGHEAILQRTPEQDAAQEALGKLVRQCMTGDQHAWQQLVVSQHRRIYAICYRFTGSASDAEDLTQDVFLKLYRNLASFDTQKGSFQTWITTL